MGIFKQMKDLKDMAVAAPGMAEQAQQMAAQAQAMSAQMMAQQQAAMQQAMAQPAVPTGPPAPVGTLEPICGVDISLYATIVKAIAPLGYDQTLLPGIAATHGIEADAWQQAHDGWNHRIQTDPAVAGAFNGVYRSA